MYEVRRSHIARAILDYLFKHPAAQDTVSGIADWWLPEEKIKTRAAIVKDALTLLVNEGLVLERIGTDSQVHYRINGDRLIEIESLLREKDGSRPSTFISVCRRLLHAIFHRIKLLVIQINRTLN